MKENIATRIFLLRKWIKKNGIDAFVIPSSDAHLSEYVAPYWKCREWISGFTGSAGTIVITAKEVGLWTDSRYFIQATEQLNGTGITLYKEMLPETPTINQFLCNTLSQGSVVGINGSVFSINSVRRLEAELLNNKLTLRTNCNPFDEIWNERLPIPQNPAYIYDTKYCGKSCKEKIADIRNEVNRLNCQGILLSALDEIAWTLNLRGSDINFNPVVISYLLITEKESIFFVLPDKITPEVSEYLKEQGVSVAGYMNITTSLNNLDINTILIDAERTNFAVYSSINHQCKITEATSPVQILKSIRNEKEIAGVHSCMKKDGVALVKFLKWLEEAVQTEKETEISVAEKLRGFRAQQDLFMGESFETIAGYSEHAAIVHYTATPETCSVLKPEGFLLLDSGAQYLDGTTDITRTIALGSLTEEEKIDYTLVLKGHIALASAKFPAGTRGAQLDVLARMPLWKRGMNFLHGTGHGIGHFLNVHEGPQSIRMNENPITLQPGMLTSNEPGVYKAGSHGIRIENLILVKKESVGMYGDYYHFETVTLCPICKEGIIKKLLSSEEIEWLNNYHLKVYNNLSPSLSEEERAWLREKTTEL
ncbi:aminopeptidase P family protein [Bacteroides sp. 214]|uniref:aminopeptidase P family protein n=1 Tax=Bacteroides sp. 214 TaxID=2302935 RepID=UPI0013D55A9A|nr:aminopeptidase P family protein [Bacteroides sp. 214]NDW13540.1 aminopeptidase P family protein [Bacteroides sp. 214]